MAPIVRNNTQQTSLYKLLGARINIYFLSGAPENLAFHYGGEKWNAPAAWIILKYIWIFHLTPFFTLASHPATLCVIFAYIGEIFAPNNIPFGTRKFGIAVDSTLTDGFARVINSYWGPAMFAALYHDFRPSVQLVISFKFYHRDIRTVPSEAVLKSLRSRYVETFISGHLFCHYYLIFCCTVFLKSL